MNLGILIFSPQNEETNLSSFTQTQYLGEIEKEKKNLIIIILIPSTYDKIDKDPEFLGYHFIT